MNEFEKYKITQFPDSAYYIPSFITLQEEEFYLEKIYSAPIPKWKTLSNRRLQNWGGLPHPKGMISEEMPQWLHNCIEKVIKLNIFGNKTPNHVLVNEYLPGQGIMAHEDGPLFHPIIATINLGSHTLLDYYEKKDNKLEKKIDSCFVGSLLLEKCSLLLVKNDLYHKYLHGIEEKDCDVLDENVKNLNFCNSEIDSVLHRERRISLTIRHVPKTVKSNVLAKLIMK